MKSRRTCLLIADEAFAEANFSIFHELLTKEGLDSAVVSEAETSEALEKKPALVLVQLPEVLDSDFVARLTESLPLSPVIVFDEYSSLQRSINVFRQGASDYFTLPLEDIPGLERSIRKQSYHHKLFSESQYYREELEHSLAVLQEDQQAGHHVQQKVLPPNHTDINDYHFDYCLKPSLYLSGDYVDFFSISDSLSMFYLADISGHGASSAFVTVLLKNMSNRLLRNYVRGSSFDILSPTDVLGRINKELLDTGLGKHLTIFVGLLDRVENTLQYGIGGHFPMPILLQNGQAQYLPGGGMPAGLFEDAEFDGRIVKLEDDFQLSIFSDGILEIMEANTLEEKESMLLQACAKRYDCVSQLLASLGADDVEEAPDDIALLSVSRAV